MKDIYAIQSNYLQSIQRMNKGKWRTHTCMYFAVIQIENGGNSKANEFYSNILDRVRVKTSEMHYSSNLL